MRPVIAGAALLLVACGPDRPSQQPPSPQAARDAVLAAERAFAASMASRDFEAFASFVDEEAIFFSGTSTLQGKAQVLEGWAGFFSEPDAPFSWEPDQVEVLASGTLALSTGPVRDPQGGLIARFNSIWRLAPSGQWKVIFDKGGPPETPAAAP